MGVSLDKGILVSLLSLVTTGTSSVVAVPHSSNFLLFAIKGVGTITGGAVSIEEASSEDYAGTWSVIQAVTAADLTGGDELLVHIFATFKFVRVRISSDITGTGTISAAIMSN